MNPFFNVSWFASGEAKTRSCVGMNTESETVVRLCGRARLTRDNLSTVRTLAGVCVFAPADTSVPS